MGYPKLIVELKNDFKYIYENEKQLDKIQKYLTDAKEQGDITLNQIKKLEQEIDVRENELIKEIDDFENKYYRYLYVIGRIDEQSFVQVLNKHSKQKWEIQNVCTAKVNNYLGKDRFLYINFKKNQKSLYYSNTDDIGIEDEDLIDINKLNNAKLKDLVVYDSNTMDKNDIYTDIKINSYKTILTKDKDLCFNGITEEQLEKLEQQGKIILMSELVNGQSKKMNMFIPNLRKVFDGKYKKIPAFEKALWEYLSIKYLEFLKQEIRFKEEIMMELAINGSRMAKNITDKNLDVKKAKEKLKSEEQEFNK